MREQDYPYYYSKAAVAGFVLTLASLVLVNYFVFNDAAIDLLGMELFDMLTYPVVIATFLANRMGFVFSVIGLVNSNRYKLKGRAYAITGIVIFVIATVIMFLMAAIILLVALGGEKRPPDGM